MTQKELKKQVIALINDKNTKIDKAEFERRTKSVLKDFYLEQVPTGTATLTLNLTLK